jgi:hypothetical protein
MRIINSGYEIKESMSGLSAFIQSQERSGTVESEGRFTLSQSEQLKKLQHSVSEEPGHFALKIIQGLVACGAQEIHCKLGRSKFTVFASDCRALPAGILTHFSGPLELSNPGATLALGILGALSLDLKSVRWSLANGECVEVNSDGISELAPSTATRFEFRLRTHDFFKFLKQTLRIRSSVHREISSRCCFSPVPVYLGSRRLKASEFGSRQAASGGKLRIKQVTSGARTSFYPVPVKHSYQYWGRLEVYARVQGPTHTAPEIWGAIQTRGGEPPNRAAEQRTWYHAFHLTRCEMTQQGFEVLQEVEGQTYLQASVLIPADPKVEGGLLLIVCDGVVVHRGREDIGSSRAIAVVGSEELDLDASTLAVVRNQKFEDLLSRVRKQTGYLVTQVQSRRSLIPPEIKHKPGNLY